MNYRFRQIKPVIIKDIFKREEYNISAFIDDGSSIPLSQLTFTTIFAFPDFIRFADAQTLIIKNKFKNIILNKDGIMLIEKKEDIGLNRDC